MLPSDPGPDGRRFLPKPNDCWGAIMLKIGLLLDSRYSSKYVHELCRWAQDQQELEISHLIICTTGSGKINDRLKAWLRRGPAGLLAELAWRIILATEGLLLRFFQAHHDHYDLF